MTTQEYKLTVLVFQAFVDKYGIQRIPKSEIETFVAESITSLSPRFSIPEEKLPELLAELSDDISIYYSCDLEDDLSAF